MHDNTESKQTKSVHNILYTDEVYTLQAVGHDKISKRIKICITRQGRGLFFSFLSLSIVLHSMLMNSENLRRSMK